MAIFKVSVTLEVEAKSETDAVNSVYNTVSLSPWWRLKGIVVSEINQGPKQETK